MVTHCQRRKQFTAGFTLLELLVVLTIAGLLAALVPPLYSKAVPGARLKMAAKDFAISLRAARSRAVTTNSQIDLKLIAHPPSYAVGGKSAVQMPRGVVMTPYDYFLAAHEPLADTNALTMNDFAIHFYPDGSSNGAVVKVANRGNAYRVDVSWLTGNIRISEVGEHER